MLSAVLWILDEALLWVVPLIVASAILVSMPLNATILLILGTTVTVTVISGWLMIWLDWGIWNSIRNSLFVGGIALFFLTFMVGLLTSKIAPTQADA
jgi:hypothetical protein